MRTRIAFVILIWTLSAASIVGAQALPPLYRIDTVAGTMPNEEDVPVRLAYLTRPACALSDGAGGVLIVEQEAHRIRRVAPDGKITLFAGTGAFGFSGDGGPAVLAELNEPTFAVRDAAGNVYVSDTKNHRVRRIAPNGTMSTIAGDGNAAHQGDNGPATAASINLPQGIAVDSGRLYIAELGGQFLQDGWIRVVDLESGIISAFAGGRRDPAEGVDAKSGYIATPAQLAIGPGGALIYADYGLYRVRVIGADGKIRTLAGSSSRGGPANTGEGDGGPAALAKLYAPYGVAVDASGMVYVSDYLGHRVRRFPFSGGSISTVAGSSLPGFAGDGSAGTAARFDSPRGLNLAGDGGLLIADRNNQRIRLLSAAGVMSTFAGQNQYGGDGGRAVDARLSQPRSVALDAGRNILFTDRGNHVIRLVDPSGGIKLHSGKPNQFTNRGATTQIVGALAQILWNDPHGIAVRMDGGIYVGDSGTVLPRLIDARNNVTLLGISGSSYRPTDVALNAANTFVTLSDPDGHRLHRVNLTTKSGEVLGVSGLFAGDGGKVSSARLQTPEAVAYDPSGNLWVADSNHHRLRRVDAGDIINTMAGTGRAENSGDFGPAAAASVAYPVGIAFAQNGRGFVSTGHCIRALFTDGTIATIAGSCGKGAFSGDAGPAIAARLNSPQGLTVDAGGRVFFADSGNHRIRVLTPVPALALEIVSGDKQSRLATAPLERPLVVRLLAQGPIAYPFAPVTWSVSQGTAALAATAGFTGADGVLSVTATLGESAGPVAVTAIVPGVAPVTFALTARPLPWIAGVTGGAGNNPVTAPGSLLLISGSNFDPATACLYVNEAKVPMLEIAASRIVAQAPAAAGDTLTVAVSGDCATTGEVRSTPVSAPVAIAAPEFYYWKDKSVRAVVADSDEAIGPAGLLPERAFRAARPGDVVAILATGFGPTDPALDPGVPAAGPAALTLPVQVTLGDLTLAPEDIVYAGPATGKLGQYELRIRIPAGAPSGELPIRIAVGEAISPDTATLTVENPPPPQ
jgi:uncharacterized protein (TIGR03437 family)